MEKCQSLVDLAFVPYGDVACHDGSIYQVDIHPSVM